MNNNNHFTASVENILNQANIDFRIETAQGYLSDDCTELLPDTYNDVKPVAAYMNSNDAFKGLPNKRETEKFLLDALDKVMANLTDTVEFQQTMNPYKFKVSSSTFVTFLPLVTTRALISMLKTLGIKCEVYKRNKSVCNNLDVYLTELAFQGKSDIDIPEFKPVADACKAIKGKLICWFKDNIVHVEDNTPHLSEASARFRGAEWFDSAQNDVTLIGAGGLGSNIAVSLCRVLGDRQLCIYDPDFVEHKNLAGQNFGVSDIGLNKAKRVAEQCINYNPEIDVVAKEQRFDEGSWLNDITITGLDNMASRGLVFSKWQGKLDDSDDYFKSRMLLIDARLSAEKWQIFCITGDNKAAQEEYEKNWLFTDDEADSDVCSYKQTAYAAQMCASFVTNLYINFCTNLLKDKDDPVRRFLPFMTEYDASQMLIRYKEVA